MSVAGGTTSGLSVTATRPVAVVAVCDRDADPRRAALGNVEQLAVACNEVGVSLDACSYADLLGGSLPGAAFDSNALLVLFFPYAHWNGAIEGGSSVAPYGGRIYLEAFQRYLTEVDQALSTTSADVLNPPALLALVRDKMAVKQAWSTVGVSTPPWRPLRTPEDVAGALDEWGTVYIKTRCSSNTKGISVLTLSRWRSNFRLVDGRLLPPLSSEDDFLAREEWTFADVPVGDTTFLAALDGDDCFMEQGVTHGGRLETRVWCAEGRVVHLDVLCAPAGSATAGHGEGGVSLSESEAGAHSAVQVAAGVGLDAAIALGIRFGVIDVVVSEDGGAWAIDAQAFPPPSTKFDTWMEVLFG